MKCKECNKNNAPKDREICDSCLKKTKICSICGETKSIFDFQKNQKTVTGAVSRRGGCIECRKSKKPLSAKARREYNENHPPPKIGEPFLCPICDRVFERQFSNEVTLDHDHASGRIRGYICRMCNNAMGMMDDNPKTLDKAAKWLRGTLSSWFL